MLKAYTDAAYNKDSGVATSLFLSETTFYGILTVIYPDVISSTEAELRGILQSIKWVRKHMPEVKKMEMYTDCRTLKTAYLTILSNRMRVPNNMAFADIWRDVIRTMGDMRVRLIHTPAHLEGFNENKVCDKLSNAVLKAR